MKLVIKPSKTPTTLREALDFTEGLLICVWQKKVFIFCKETYPEKRCYFKHFSTIVDMHSLTQGMPSNLADKLETFDTSESTTEYYYFDSLKEFCAEALTLGWTF